MLSSSDLSSVLSKCSSFITLYSELTSCHNIAMEESGSGQKFCLKWNQYSSNLAASLAGMRESGAMTDVTLVTEDGARFLAHRVVLAAASNFFR